MRLAGTFFPLISHRNVSSPIGNKSVRHSPCCSFRPMSTTMRISKYLALIMLSVGLAGAEQRPSENFRKEHVQIRERLSRISDLVGKLPNQPASQQRDTMKRVTAFFMGHIKPHAEWEEKVLYPAVDKRAGSQTHLFTATMRNDHKIVGRWISELESESEKTKADPKAFARKTDRLLGLITAHFENEEEVLLPVLDKSMTSEEFEREIMKKSEHTY